MSNYDFSTPAWVHQAVFYQIFPDRFAISSGLAKPGKLQAWNAPPTVNGFKGGDLAGIMEKLDYIQDLGITAIYMTPIFQSACNHRYHTHDYFQIDPLLGGNMAFRSLLDEAHRRGMRIVLDGVFNHASRGFFAFNHILETGAESPYVDWFKVHGYPMHAYEGRPNYECWWNLPALPSFNHANPQVKKYIMDVARYWIDQGIDGWRLDVPMEVKTEGFWQEFRRVVKEANPEAYITGEIPFDASQWLQGDQFDGVMNYVLTYACWAFFGGDRLNLADVGQWKDHMGGVLKVDAPAFARNIQELLTRYPHPAALAQLNLLDSHDTARILNLLSGEKVLVRLALLFLMTYPGAPCVYYGDEIGLAGCQDPDNRCSFPWDEAVWDHDLRKYVQKCISIRKSHPALSTGSFKVLFAEGQRLAYLRQLKDERLLVLINRSTQNWQVDLDLKDDFPGCQSLSGQMKTSTYAIQSGRLADMNLPPFAGEILG